MEPSVNKEVTVAIIGAGPAGLATSACLNYANVPNIVLEKENVCAPLWKKRAYDRLKLHLAKEFCNLPHMPFRAGLPRFVPRADFVDYLDDYASYFGIQPYYNRTIVSASYDRAANLWRIEARNTEASSGEEEETYYASFLVVASGENSQGAVPMVPGLDGFTGEWMHSSGYHNGNSFADKDVLVVGCGNSGMEISYDLSCYGANTSILIRNPVHVLNKEIVFVGMKLLKYLPMSIVDNVVVLLSKLKYGNMKNYSIERPKEGPFFLKQTTGRTPTIDVGAMEKIKGGNIKVYHVMEKIHGDVVEFEDGQYAHFDAIIFATGYRSTVWNWLEDGEDLFNSKGMPKARNQWKGKKGLYCAGFSGRGLEGISQDAMKIANDIASASVPRHLVTSRKKMLLLLNY